MSLFTLTAGIITLGLAIVVHREISGEFPFHAEILKLVANFKRLVVWTVDMISAMVIMALINTEFLSIVTTYVHGYGVFPSL